MTDLERKRVLARERQRRRRERIKAGRCLVTVEVDDVDLALALAAEGDLDPMVDDDPSEVRAALQRVLQRWCSDHA